MVKIWAAARELPMESARDARPRPCGPGYFLEMEKTVVVGAKQLSFKASSPTSSPSTTSTQRSSWCAAVRSGGY